MDTIFIFQIGFLEINWVDIIDIALVTLLLYQLYKLMRGSVAIKIFVGFLSLYLIYLVVRALKMELVSAILGQFMGVGVIAAIILFQQEIRKFLLIIGRTTSLNKSKIFKITFWRKRQDQSLLNLTPIIEAAKALGGSNTGALIVFSKNSPLKFYVESGDLIDASISKRLIVSIFNKNSPLHDGAAIIYKSRLKAARCILPVTEQKLPAKFGLRHRAAIGMTEVTDTIVLVVSEETGQMSLAQNGIIDHSLSGAEVRKKINKYFTEK